MVLLWLWILIWYLQVMLFLIWNSTMRNRDYKENTDIKIIVVMALLVSFFVPPWTYPLYYGLAQCLHTVGSVYFSASWFCLWICDFFLPIEWGGRVSEPVLTLGTIRSLCFYLFSFTFAITIGRTCLCKLTGSKRKMKYKWNRASPSWAKPRSAISQLAINSCMSPSETSKTHLNPV